MNKKITRRLGKNEKNGIRKMLPAFLLLAMLLLGCTGTVLAAGSSTADEEATAVSETAANEETEEASDSTGSKAVAAALAIGLAAAAGALGMGIAIAKSVEGIARQPEAEGKIRTSLMLGLVFVETAIIYALIVAILIIFVL